MLFFFIRSEHFFHFLCSAIAEIDLALFFFTRIPDFSVSVETSYDNVQASCHCFTWYCSCPWSPKYLEWRIAHLFVINCVALLLFFVPQKSIGEPRVGGNWFESISQSSRTEGRFIYRTEQESSPPPLQDISNSTDTPTRSNKRASHTIGSGSSLCKMTQIVKNSPERLNMKNDFVWFHSIRFYWKLNFWVPIIL